MKIKTIRLTVEDLLAWVKTAEKKGKFTAAELADDNSEVYVEIWPSMQQRMAERTGGNRKVRAAR